MPCYSPLKGWRDEATGGITFRAEGASETMEVNCSQCLGCRLDSSRMWAARIIHEASLHESVRGNCFVTLTYRDRAECTDEQLEKGQHIPDDWSLTKSHFQKFMKRLRKVDAKRRKDAGLPPSPIRFFHCGEYGRICKHGLDLSLVSCPVHSVGRPHYHACLFNYEPPDLELLTINHGDKQFTSADLAAIWGFGFVHVGALNFDSAAYVARYSLKKVNGIQADTHYQTFDDDTGEIIYLQPEYSTMSRGRPCSDHKTLDQECSRCQGGIGYQFYRKYKADFFPSDEMPVPGEGVFKKVPPYYENLFANVDPLTLDEIKELRQQYRRDNAAEYTPSRLMQKYEVRKAQTSTLKRMV